MTAKRFIWVCAVLILTGFIGINLLVQRGLGGARLDFTQNHLFTVSSGTKSVLKDLSDPLDLTFVYTNGVGQNYPAVQSYATRVRELLAIYKAQSGGKLRIREIDPEPFSEAEDEALAAGLVAIETDGGDPLYFGLIGRNSVDDERIIPFLAPERETVLEYDLTRLIARLNRPEPARIGLLSTLPGMTMPSNDAGYGILREMRKSFTVELISEDFATLPPEMDVLMLVHPPVMTDWQLWQIDQFILRQGRALILIDPAAKTALGSGPFNMTNRQIRSDLDVFAASWGVSLGRDAVADTQTALTIELASGEGRNADLRHPLFLSVPPALMSRDSPVTADLARSVNFAAAGRLEIDANSPHQIEPLMQTGPAPSSISADQAALDLSAGETLELYEPGGDPAILAVQIMGPLVTAYPSGMPSPDMGDDDIGTELARAAALEAGPAALTSAVDAHIIMVADADMLDDGLHSDLQSGVAFADNIAFILNSLDSLSGGSDLMALRARAPGVRRMVRVDNMREAAQALYFAEQARLENRLSQSQERLEQLQAIGASGDFFDGDMAAELSQQEREELAELRDRIVETRASLRQIERDFRKDIDRLEFWLRMFTIFVGPILVAFAGLFVWWTLRRRGPA